MKKCFFAMVILFNQGLNVCAQADEQTDYALLSHRNDWSHHYAYGSPSWNTFSHFSNNPVYRGRKGMEWPVNGFLFDDPVSHDWFLYIGEYRQFYQSDDDPKTIDFTCVIYRSADKGKTWKQAGHPFPPDAINYDSMVLQSPDVMITYADGKYHMVFDWVPADFSRSSPERTGLGYAVADKPEGPFMVSKTPVKINTELRKKPLLGRYWRMYAPMIIKRKQDWVLAYLMDTDPPRSWALALSTADRPEGPYGATRIMLNVEKKTSYPPLLEFYPAFLRKDSVYFPGTSVSVNRNCQSLFRVKTEEMTDPARYEQISTGSFWNSIPAENEYAGIWGQTVTGFIDDKDSIYVMFPSKDASDFGTINLASASWKHLDRDTGFSFSANYGNSFSYIKKPVDMHGIDMNYTLDGALHLVWDFRSPIDIENGWGKFSIDRPDAEYKEVVIDKYHWRIRQLQKGRIVYVDSGGMQQGNGSANNLQLKKEKGKYILVLNGKKCWEGILTGSPGLIGLFLDPHSFLYCNRFAVKGSRAKGSVTYGFYEALVNAGGQDGDWTFRNDSMFLHGWGAVSKKDSGFVKWNFEGKGFKLFSPKGPQYGVINIYLDGRPVGSVSLKRDGESPSAAVFEYTGVKTGSHAVYIECMDGLLPVDCIRVDL